MHGFSTKRIEESNDWLGCLAQAQLWVLSGTWARPAVAQTGDVGVGNRRVVLRIEAHRGHFWLSAGTRAHKRKRARLVGPSA